MGRKGAKKGGSLVHRGKGSKPKKKLIRAKLDMRKMCLLDNFLRRGWHVMDDDDSGNEDEEEESNQKWHFYWATVQTVRYIFHEKNARLRTDQRINHFPSHFELTRKDLLVKHCKQYRKDMERKGLPCPEIVPITYYLPQDYGIFADECRRRPDWTWIVKPVGKAQGKGIFLVNKISQAKRFHPSNLKRNEFDAKADDSREEMYVVSRYIDKPLLVCGKKFDLRLYVLVVSFHPLIVYIHQQGFARFCSVEYTYGESSSTNSYNFDERESARKHGREDYLSNEVAGDVSRAEALKAMGVTNSSPEVEEEGKANSNDISNLDMHLTNVSLQKHHEEYSDSHGGKWPLRLLIQYLRSTRGPAATEHCLSRIRDLVYHSLRAVQRAMTSPEQCFELYGYDVLLDDNLTPWLIEVNASPSLSATTEADRRMKSSIVSDMLDIVIPETTPKVPVRSEISEPRPRPTINGDEPVCVPSTTTKSNRLDDASWSRHASVIKKHNKLQKKIFQPPSLPSTEEEKRLFQTAFQGVETESFPPRASSNAYQSRANQDIDDEELTAGPEAEAETTNSKHKKVAAAGAKYRGTVQERQRALRRANEVEGYSDDTEDSSDSSEEEEDTVEAPARDKIETEERQKKLNRPRPPDKNDVHGEWKDDEFEWKPHRQNQFELLFDERKAQKKCRVLGDAGLPVDQSYRLRASDEPRVGVKTIRQGQLKEGSNNVV
eukprot:gb/GECG01000808.1/.p1 GENE.gb/GECG01000808.1/~~gb/GECG01000808.1/.p1  ORF type:complete len:717 (+),score=115.40 gb/GECG01000808.1/:1-2151(+)